VLECVFFGDVPCSARLKADGAGLLVESTYSGTAARPGDPGQHQIGDRFAALVDRRLRRHVDVEHARERVAVGDVVKAERADRHVELDRIDVVAEHAFLLAAVEDPPGRVDRRDIQLADDLRLLEKRPVVQVLVHDDPHGVGVGVVMVERAAHELAERFVRRPRLEVEPELDAAQPSVGGLEHREVERLLATEVVVDHALAGPGARGDLVDARPAEAVARELLGRDFHDIGHRSLRHGLNRRGAARRTRRTRPA